jgi:hypothetical protein
MLDCCDYYNSQHHSSELRSLFFPSSVLPLFSHCMQFTLINLVLQGTRNVKTMKTKAENNIHVEE